MHLVANLLRSGVALLLVGLISACAAPNPAATTAEGILDPYERQNRRVHAFNRGLDRTLVRPASKGYTTIVPDPLEDNIGNFATNLDRPSGVVNAVLQGDLQGAGLSTFRFVINTVLGFGGIVDVASEFGIADHETDFGETLHVWGVREGAYLELPFVGPTTERDAFGIFVDLFTNPLRYTLEAPEENYGSVASVAKRLGDRGRFSDTVDSILYESADSYAQARLIYMQNRRFELGDESAEAEIDPFALDTEGF